MARLARVVVLLAASSLATSASRAGRSPNFMVHCVVRGESRRRRGARRGDSEGGRTRSGRSRERVVAGKEERRRRMGVGPGQEQRQAGAVPIPSKFGWLADRRPSSPRKKMRRARTAAAAALVRAAVSVAATRSVVPRRSARGDAAEASLYKGRRPFIFIAGVEGSGHHWFAARAESSELHERRWAVAATPRGARGWSEGAGRGGAAGGESAARARSATR